MMKSMKGHLLVTGAAGFIGSAFARTALTAGYRVTVLDALTYAGHQENLQEILKEGQCELVVGAIQNFELVSQLFQKNQFTGVVNLAAESHVDNSISGPKIFIETNVIGTFTLLEVARKNLGRLPPNFRFLHVSTDEVFGALGETGQFSENTSYKPNSPYSASKAASDHLVRAWFHTYGLPTITTNCSNNYGPRQFPEKLIPLMIRNALAGKSLPVYGQGANVRDWIHVEDHVSGVLLAFEKGEPGGSYCFGGRSERRNLDVVKRICEILDEKQPRADGQSYQKQIQFVQDRAGHDYRYSIDDTLAESKLGFRRKYEHFEEGLRATIDWYHQNQDWVEQVLRSAQRA